MQVLKTTIDHNPRLDWLDFIKVTMIFWEVAILYCVQYGMLISSLKEVIHSLLRDWVKNRMLEMMHLLKDCIVVPILLTILYHV